MVRKSVQQTGQFTAHSEDGTEYTIVEFTPFTERQLLDGTSHRIPGVKELRTTDGKPVNRLAKGTYSILDFDWIEVYSDDPASP